MVEIKTYRQFLKEDGPKIKQLHMMPLSKWTKLSNGLWVTPFKRFGLAELDEIYVCITDNPSENFSENFLDINSWTYGINYKDDLLKMGFTKQEMDKFIADKYEECVKEKKEIKTTGGE